MTAQPVVAHGQTDLDNTEMPWTDTPVYQPKDPTSRHTTSAELTG